MVRQPMFVDEALGCLSRCRAGGDLGLYAGQRVAHAVVGVPAGFGVEHCNGIIAGAHLGVVDLKLPKQFEILLPQAAYWVVRELRKRTREVVNRWGSGMGSRPPQPASCIIAGASILFTRRLEVSPIEGRHFGTIGTLVSLSRILNNGVGIVWWWERTETEA
ncbi:hypothetical protein D9611_013643 [Ephemerocybe angulata]|uniref:Uncharacterized protein n=1 Tax=Ephemerocybe angulata TaxID=980116 RepID=A0A8H5ARY2_9AGAR|nr:hypothetical protein D9611_013643 [Tulosesus angulatus]